MGKSKTWTSWVPDVAQICQNQVEAIEKHLQASPAMRQIFNGFRDQLSDTVRTNLSAQEAIKLLAQHIVVKPVLDVLFKEFPFTEKNPIAHAMTSMLSQLELEGLLKPNQVQMPAAKSNSTKHDDSSVDVGYQAAAPSMAAQCRCRLPSGGSNHNSPSTDVGYQAAAPSMTSQSSADAD